MTETCDDCGRPYDGPAYYTFDPATCSLEAQPGAEERGNYYSIEHTDARGGGAICTGNLCPDCSGPDLAPDDPADRRRPARVETEPAVLEGRLAIHESECRFCRDGLRCHEARALEMRLMLA